MSKIRINHIRSTPQFHTDPLGSTHWFHTRTTPFQHPKLLSSIQKTSLLNTKIPQLNNKNPSIPPPLSSTPKTPQITPKIPQFNTLIISKPKTPQFHTPLSPTPKTPQFNTSLSYFFSEGRVELRSF